MNRRSFLRGVAGVTAVSTASLAGCLGGDDSSPEAIDWIPAPEFVAGESYRVFSTAPATVGGITDRLEPATVDAYRSQWLDWEVASPDLSDVQRYTSGEADAPGETVDAGYIAVEHELDRGMLADSLRSDGFEATGEYEGFDIYEGEGGARGLGEGTLLAGADPDGGTGLVESLIDASLGEIQRYHEANDAVADVVDALDLADNFRFRGYQKLTETIARQGVFEGSIGRGYSLTLGEETVEATRVEAFASDSDVSEEAIQQFTDENPLFTGGEGVDWSVEDGLLSIEWTADPGTLTPNQLG
jgi:hypothetical protein